jgi:hypothetical protein
MNKILLITLSIIILASMACANDSTPQDNCKQLLHEGVVKAYRINPSGPDLVRFSDGTEYNASAIFYIDANGNDNPYRSMSYRVIDKKYKLYVCDNKHGMLLVPSENTAVSDDCECK